jgi:hypothetical protein
MLISGRLLLVVFVVWGAIANILSCPFACGEIVTSHLCEMDLFSYFM